VPRLSPISAITRSSVTRGCWLCPTSRRGFRRRAAGTRIRRTDRARLEHRISLCSRACRPRPRRGNRPRTAARQRTGPDRRSPRQAIAPGKARSGLPKSRPLATTARAPGRSREDYREWPKPAAQTNKADKISEIETALQKKFYSDMLLIRRFEEKAGQLYGMGLIGGFCHLYIGQEAVVVGMQAALQPGDGHHRLSRSRPHAGLRHGPERRHGRADRPRHRLFQGKGGSMHMFSREKNFFGGHGIVGAQVPIGTGLAFARNTARPRRRVTLTYFGDGAANQGQVYESFNMAELWKLPVVYVIENNQYAMGTSVERSSAQAQFSKRGASFNIPARKSTAWMSKRCTLPARRRSNGAAPARARSFSNEDLSLSRPFDVGPREIPHARGSAGSAREARSHRAFRPEADRARRRDGGRSQGDRQGDARHREHGGRIRHRKPGARRPEELYTDVLA
jgi:hypothetical protein